MKFKVSDECIGCNLCALTCPQVFSMNEHEKSQAIEGDVPQENQANAILAMQQCPVVAIEQID